METSRVFVSLEKAHNAFKIAKSNLKLDAGAEWFDIESEGPKSEGEIDAIRFVNGDDHRDLLLTDETFSDSDETPFYEATSRVLSKREAVSYIEDLLRTYSLRSMRDADGCQDPESVYAKGVIVKALRKVKDNPKESWLDWEIEQMLDW